MKFCPRCKQNKEDEEFFRDKRRTADGLSGYCKDCKKAVNRKYLKRRFSRCPKCGYSKPFYERKTT